MNIKEELLKEHTKANALKIADYACTSAANFKKLMACFLSGEYLIAQRAAWSVRWATNKQPKIILPYIKYLVAQLSKTGIHPAVLRNSLCILQDVDIPKAHHGELMNACFNLLETPSTPIAVKVFAMANLHSLSRQYPEIKDELKLIVKTNWDNESAAFRARGKSILNS